MASHNGFSYKQPKGVPHKFDEAKQQAFIEAYEALKASFGKDESIVFIGALNLSDIGPLLFVVMRALIVKRLFAFSVS